MKTTEPNEIPTPRTDEALIDNADLSDQGYGKSNYVYSDFARQLERELHEALKWKNEDPRMLREQIRVADEAFNNLQKRFNEALQFQSELEAVARAAEAHCISRFPEDVCDGLNSAVAALKQKGWKP